MQCMSHLTPSHHPRRPPGQHRHPGPRWRSGRVAAGSHGRRRLRRRGWPGWHQRRHGGNWADWRPGRACRMQRGWLSELLAHAEGLCRKLLVAERNWQGQE